MGREQEEKNGDDGGFQRARWSILLAATGYAIAVLMWGLRQDGRITQLELHHSEFERRIDRIDERGSRQFPIVADKLSSLERQVSRINNLENQINLARQLAIDAMERANHPGTLNRLQRLPHEDRW